MKSTEPTNFQFWVNYLKVISIFFALMGVMWAILGSFDPFGIYDSFFADSFWGKETLPLDAEITKSFLLVPLGMTNAAYFILQFFIAKNAFAKKELWGYHAIIFGFSIWFILDTIMSIYHQALFNVFIANVPCLLAMLPIYFTKKYFKKQQPTT